MEARRDTDFRRILIVDDSRDIHADFAKILQRSTERNDALGEAATKLFGDAPSSSAAPREQYDLDFACQGEEGLAKVQQSLDEDHPYALAFVDVRMPPGWDGVETASQIMDLDPHIQIVICTAYSDYSVDEMIDRLGWSDRLMIIKKPYDCAEVRLLALSLTEKWQLSQSAALLLQSLIE